MLLTGAFLLATHMPGKEVYSGHPDLILGSFLSSPVPTMQIRIWLEAATSLARELRRADDAPRCAINKEKGSWEGRLVAAKIAASFGCNMIAQLLSLLYSRLNDLM